MPYWSVDGQTPEYLAMTRMISLDDRIVNTILTNLDLKPGDTVLDIGCGSGEYCFRLGSQTAGIRFTGVDNDPLFIEFAEKRACGQIDYPFEQSNSANEYDFIQCNGLNMPFEDNVFDAVISHTYLTAISNWRTALDEMVRVCKPSGTVSSVTSLTENFFGIGSLWLFNCMMSAEDANLVDKAYKAMESAFTPIDLTPGAPPQDVPGAFAECGLRRVRCIPLAHYFCLSDALLSEERYRRHIDLLRLIEVRQLERALSIGGVRPLLSDAEWIRYREIIDERHGTLMQMSNANDEWSWYGNSSLLVCGTKPE